MREILRTNDVVYISWVTRILADSGIKLFTLDEHMSVLEGSAGAISRRLMVADSEFRQARELIEMAERERASEPIPDYILGGRLLLCQPKEGFRAGIEPIILAAAVPSSASGQVLELGCGVGTATLCYASRVADSSVTAVEKQSELARLASDNVAKNHFTGRIRIINEDIILLHKTLTPCSFYHVMANPPFVEEERADPKMHPMRWGSHVEGSAKLADWVSVARKLLKPKGTFNVIYDAGRIDDLIALLKVGFGGITIFPLWPSVQEKGQDAKRVLVQARKGVKSPARIARGLVLHDINGSFTVAAANILERGSALAL
ncbi:MAG: DUF2007 domain-containing protein [Pseudomonadota bacterium]|nr:DUF2007 domain-containing protein [Pseudomonadota bacterium]